MEGFHWGWGIRSYGEFQIDCDNVHWLANHGIAAKGVHYGTNIGGSQLRFSENVVVGLFESDVTCAYEGVDSGFNMIDDNNVPASGMQEFSYNVKAFSTYRGAATRNSEGVSHIVPSSLSLADSTRVINGSSGTLIQNQAVQFTGLDAQTKYGLVGNWTDPNALAGILVIGDGSNANATLAPGATARLVWRGENFNVRTVNNASTGGTYAVPDTANPGYVTSTTTTPVGKKLIFTAYLDGSQPYHPPVIIQA